MIFFQKNSISTEKYTTTIVRDFKKLQNGLWSDLDHSLQGSLDGGLEGGVMVMYLPHNRKAIGLNQSFNCVRINAES